MLTYERTPLPGQATLFGSWGALAARSPGAHFVSTNSSLAAVFPEWAELNNAVLLDQPSQSSASAAAAELAEVYGAAGVGSWALWLPNAATDFDAPDPVSRVDGMRRATSTLVMTRELSAGFPTRPGVRRTTVQAVSRAGDVPVPAADLPDPDDAADMEGWVLVVDDFAVSAAWTYRDGADVGVYAVGTPPQWRRRGLASALMRHILGEYFRRGARTASLQSTLMGRPLYESLGFTAVGRYDEWAPANTEVVVSWYDGDRDVLRPLFAEAEDSAAQLDSYLHEGRVLVAWRGDSPVGHLQLVPLDHDTVELKNMAIVEECRGAGIGRRLVDVALTAAADDGALRMLVATAAADTGNLRFYQRCGFRFVAAERDAFTADTGYPNAIFIDGIPLRDRVWLDRPTVVQASEAGTDEPPSRVS